MNDTLRSTLVRLFGGLLASACSMAAVTVSAQEMEKVTYADHVTPILREACFGCHNGDKTSGGLNLTNYAKLMEGGGSGGAIEPGDPSSSYLYMLITHESEPAMPPSSPKLADAKLEIIRKWIEGGALETSGSIARKSNKPKVEMTLDASALGKPAGEPAMPPRMSLEPIIHTARGTAVTAIASSPWAPLLAVAGQQQVLLYHADSLDLLGVLPFPEGVPHVLKFSRGGNLLLAGGGHAAKSGKVVVWDVKTGERMIEVGDEYDTVLAADISPDQSLIALGGPSKVVRVYSTATGELQYELKKHTEWIYALEFSPDNVLLATADRNGGLVVWEAAAGREYLVLSGHSAAVTDVSWRIDGNLLASASEDNSVRLWELENGGQVKTWNSHGGVLSVEFGKDGRIATCGRDGITRIWDGNGAEQKALPTFGDVATRVVWNHDATRVIAGGWTGEIRVSNAADGAMIGKLSANPQPLQARLASAQARVTQLQAEGEQVAATAAASQQAAEKATADLAALQASIEQLAVAEKTSQAASAEFEAAIAKSQAAIDGLNPQVTQKQVEIDAAAATAAQAKQAAEAAPQDTALAEASTQAQAAVDALVAQKAVLEQTVQTETAALTDAQTKLAAAKNELEKTVAALAAARPQVEPLTAAVKTAADMAAAHQAAATAHATLLAASQADVAKWTDAIAFAAQVAEQTKNAAANEQASAAQ